MKGGPHDGIIALIRRHLRAFSLTLSPACEGIYKPLTLDFQVPEV